MRAARASASERVLPAQPTSSTGGYRTVGDTGEVSPGHHGCMSKTSIKTHIEIVLTTQASGRTSVDVSVMTPAGLVESRCVEGELAVMALAGALVADWTAGHVIVDSSPDGTRIDRWVANLYDGDCRLRTLEKVAERVLENVSGQKGDD